MEEMFLLEFTKNLQSFASNAADFDVDVDIFKNVTKTTNITQTVDLTGNSAILFADVEALGEATEVEVDTSILTIANQLSSISVFAESASQNGDKPKIFTPIGVDVLGNGTLTGDLDSLGVLDTTIEFSHDDFDDWNPLLDLLSPDDITGGSPPLGPDSGNPGAVPPTTLPIPTEPNNISFDNIPLIAVADVTPGDSLFNYVSTDEIVYNFGEIEALVADLTTDDPNDHVLVRDDLEVIIQQGTPFLVEDLGNGVVQTIVDIDTIIDSGGLNEFVTLEFGGIGNLDNGQWSLGSFEYEHEFNSVGEIGDYAVNFTTEFGVITNPPAPSF